MHLFDAIEGEHAAILGLPMLALLNFLRQARHSHTLTRISYFLFFICRAG